MAACGGDVPTVPPEPVVITVGSFLLKPYTGAVAPPCDATAAPAFGPLTAGTPYNVLVVALGDDDTTFSPIFEDNVTLSSTDPHDGAVTTRKATDGCVTFQNLLAVSAGTGFTLTADTTSVRGVRSSSTPYDVNAGAASRLAVRVIGTWIGNTPPNPAAPDQQVVPDRSGPEIVGEPVGLTAGVPFDVEVFVTDALGNVVAGAPAIDVVPAFDTFNSPCVPVSGTTFTCTVYRATPSQRVVATDQATVLQRGDSSYFGVDPDAGGAAGLVVLLPGQVIRPTSGGGFLSPSPILANPKVGQNFQVKVEAIDVFGNIVPSGQDTITLSNPGAPATQLFVARLNLVAGQTAFSVLAKTALGGQQLSATGLVLPTATSDTFDIDPPDPIIVTATLSGAVPGQGILGNSAAFRLDSANQTPDPSAVGHEFSAADYAAVSAVNDGLSTATSAPDTAGVLVRPTGVPGIVADMPPRQDLSCAYDSDRSQMVFFGGSDEGIPFDDTWEWDGASLNRVSPAVTSDFRPAARSSHGMIHVPGVGVIVFGGLSARGRLNDIWIWDGTNWFMPTQNNPPSPRLGSAMSYDASQGYAVVFGGETNSGLTNELWLYDGANWALTPSSGTVPPPRAGAKLVYDPGRAVHVLVGGRESSGLASDHYELQYTGSNWQWTRRDGTEISLLPPGRTSHVAGFDTNRNVVVLYGGYLPSGVGGASQVWEFDNASLNGPEWDTAGVSGLPSLVGAAGCFDQIRNVFVIAGGQLPSSSLNLEVYRWDGVAGAAGFDIQRSAYGPEARTGGAMGYLETDSAGFPSQRVFLFGGRSAGGSLLNDLWTQDSSTGFWTQLSPVADLVDLGMPPPMERAKLVEDTARDTLVLYGGESSSGGVTTIWDLRRDWRPLTGSAFQMNGTDLTATVNDGNFAVELQAGDIVDVNGTIGTVASVVTPNLATIMIAVADTGVQATANKLVWEWDPWIRPSADFLAPPSARTGTAVAYDEANSKVVVFGGLIGSGVTAQTWFWDGTQWSTLPFTSLPRPQARIGAAMAFDPATGQVLLFGGQGANGYLSDTWTWDGTDWTPMADLGSTPPPMRDAVLFRAGPNGLILVGGTMSGGKPVSGEWFWDGAAWYHLDGLGYSHPRPGAAAAYDSNTETAIWFGGVDTAAQELELLPVPAVGPWSPGIDPFNPDRYSVEIYDFAVAVPQGATVSQTSLTVVGGGLGAGGPGTDVYIQRADGVWDYVGGHGSGPRFCPKDPVDPAQCLVDRTVSVTYPSSTYLVNGHVRLAVSSATTSSDSVRSLQSTDYLEVKIGYLP